MLKCNSQNSCRFKGSMECAMCSNNNSILEEDKEGVFYVEKRQYTIKNILVNWYKILKKR